MYFYFIPVSGGENAPPLTASPQLRTFSGSLEWSECVLFRLGVRGDYSVSRFPLCSEASSGVRAFIRPLAGSDGLSGTVDHRGAHAPPLALTGEHMKLA